MNLSLIENSSIPSGTIVCSPDVADQLIQAGCASSMQIEADPTLAPKTALVPSGFFQAFDLAQNTPSIHSVFSTN